MKIQQALNLSMKKNINLFHIYLIFILALAGCAGQQVNEESASIYQQGMDAATQGDYATAFDLYKKSANMGNDDAQLALGAMYLAGLSTAQDIQKGLMWIQKAADQENALAQLTLGGMYLEGKGVTQDYQKARNLIEKAAYQEHALAQFTLGGMYLEGKGVTQDNQEARKWLQRAADNGLSQAKQVLQQMDQ